MSLINVVPPKSLVRFAGPWTGRTRKGSAVYVSLSSYSLVKEHGDGSPMSGSDTLSALENRSNRRSGEASFSQKEPRAKDTIVCGGAALVVRIYRQAPEGCQQSSFARCDREQIRRPRLAKWTAFSPFSRASPFPIPAVFAGSGEKPHATTMMPELDFTSPRRAARPVR